MATRPSKHVRSSGRNAASTETAHAHLRVLRADEPVSPEQLEHELLSFDVDDDIASIIPMPKTIPLEVRTAITQALVDRFEFADSLDEWLYAPCETLGGAVPYDCIVYGDGMAFLRALGATDAIVALGDLGAGAPKRVPLKVVR